jgi:hypothetical protein
MENSMSDRFFAGIRNAILQVHRLEQPLSGDLRFDLAFSSTAIRRTGELPLACARISTRMRFL